MLPDLQRYWLGGSQLWGKNLGFKAPPSGCRGPGSIGASAAAVTASIEFPRTSFGDNMTVRRTSLR